MPACRIGKFLVLGTLGSGAHSAILHVRRSEDSKNYALKVVPIHGKQEEKYLTQARHEFHVAQLFDHPNLIKIFALETQRDWLFRTRQVQLLIEYVNGRTLDTFKPLPIARLVQIFAKIAAGLTHMHRRGVYHADLKPNNVILSRAGEVKIIDYGLAWIKGEGKNRLQGTPEYMAPEQAKESVVNDRTDIYNFGATMYRLTTWQPLPNPLAAAGGSGIPMDTRSWRQLIKPVRDLNASAPPELASLIENCLAHNPGKRPERMHQVREVLDSLAKTLVRAPEDRLESIEW
jgi:serine/threonine protein kinase